MSVKVEQIVTDRIIEQLQHNVVPWRKPWGDGGIPRNLASGREYRGCNVFLLACQGYSSPWWLTYNQANERGGQVRKGERGTPVVFYKTFPKKNASAADVAKGRDKGFVLRYTTAFNVAQCDGIEAPVSDNRRPFNPIEECERVVAGWSTKPPINHGGGRACYIPSQDRIEMPMQDSFNTSEEYYSTLFHELTHSTGHKDRLDREGITNPIKFASHAYSFEELVAEMGAAFLCGHTGIVNATIDNSVAYIQHWISKLRQEPDWVVKAASKAAKASDLIRGVKAPTYGENEEAA